MSRKDYVVLAKSLSQVKPWSAEDVPSRDRVAQRAQCYMWDECCRAIARVLEADNARFDRDKFMSICQLDKVGI